MAENYHVHSGEEKVVQYPDKVVTNGVATCIAVGILNHKKRKGYLGHYYYWDCFAEALLDRAVREAENIGDLEIALAGNIPFSKEEAKLIGVNFEEELESCRKEGRHAIQKVKAKGIKQDRIHNHLNNPANDDSYKMMVDTETGRFEVSKEKLFD